MNILQEKVCAALVGIDKTETDDEYGWWEDTAHAEFGDRRLKQVLELLEGIGPEHTEN